MSEPRRSAEPAESESRGEREEGSEADPEGRRGRRRSKTMSRKEIARDLRRQRALGVVDPELAAIVDEIERGRSCPASTTSTST
jgi:hypothetical protein